ncbi:MAG TPA: hypothetical protein VMY88_06055 [Acidimicrobiales bacterium]|nr:hypothetical protein [Acidimicrobiales bacterium]
MSDRREENPLRGVDGPRELPLDLRARLESELSGSAVAVLPDGLDRPRAIPPPARERIEAAVLAYTRGTGALVAPGSETQKRSWYRSSGSRQWMPLVAAAVLLVVAVTGALTMGRPAGEGLVSGDLLQGSPEQKDLQLGESTTTTPGESGPPPPFSAAAAAPSMAFGATEAAPAGGTADSAAAPQSEGFDGAGRSSAQAANTPIRLGLSGPDNSVAAGFRSYMNTVNAQGGIGGSRRVETVNPSSDGLMATVSTSLAGPLDPRSAGPRLEGPAAGEGALRADTFAFSSAPERLGHLLADALYPEARPGARVALFTGTGVFDEIVPAAVESALREKGIVANRVATRDGRPGQWPDAEVAVLSMGAEDSRRWLSAASGEGYKPARGVAGLWGMADPAFAKELPEGSTVITSYATPRADEARAMSDAAGGPPSFGFVHGWATAKALALALWQSGAGSPEELARALAAFPEDDLGGLIAPYRVRSGTNSRTPEGLVLQVRGGSFVPQGGFRADPRT